MVVLICKDEVLFHTLIHRPCIFSEISIQIFYSFKIVNYLFFIV